MKTSERVGTPFTYQSSLIVWKEVKKSLDTDSIHLKKKGVPPPIPMFKESFNKDSPTTTFTYQRTAMSI